MIQSKSLRPKKIYKFQNRVIIRFQIFSLNWAWTYILAIFFMQGVASLIILFSKSNSKFFEKYIEKLSLIPSEKVCMLFSKFQGPISYRSHPKNKNLEIFTLVCLFSGVFSSIALVFSTWKMRWSLINMSPMSPIVLLILGLIYKQQKNLLQKVTIR